MKRYLFALVIFILFVGCKTQVKTVYVPVEKTTTVTEIVRDTIINYKIEYVRDSVVISADSVSFLKNKYGFSWAESKDGKLHHSLSTWPDSVIPVKVEYRDKIIEVEKPTPYPVEVEVNKLYWWQKVLMWIGVISLFIFIIIIVSRFKS